MINNGFSNLTVDKIPPEIFLHSEFIEWFKHKNIDNLSWGSSGPDFLLRDYNVIGEAKREETISNLKAAIKELFDRTKEEYIISKFKAFFIITDKYIRMYNQTNKSKWDDVKLEECVIFPLSEKEMFLDYLNNNQSKLPVENYLDYALDFVIDEKYKMCISDSLTLLFNLNNENRVIIKSGIVFNPNTEDERIVDIKCDNEEKKELFNFINKFTITDELKVKDYIKHNYSSHIPDSKKANLGKYYTPKIIVELLKDEIKNHIQNDTIVMDLACGCGAFLELFDDCHIIGRDIDEQAIEILDLLNFSNVGIDNTLINVSREKYGVCKTDDLIIIGNPPYNDTSSINKRYSTKAKSKPSPVDRDIHSRDIGRSFIEAYAKLEPRYICILHPLSYLIKKTNFNNLKYLKRNYKLENATIFNSNMFKDLGGGTPFPVIVATYKRDNIGMDYNYIQNYIFDIYNSDKKFSLLNIEQAGHDYIHQTVTSLDLNNDSDIGLYHYNFRDNNSLNKANFQNEDYRTAHKDTMLVVNFEDLWKYCYVNCIKKFMLPLLVEKDYYILGNLNPVIDKEKINNNEQYWKDLFVICSILKNSHRIDCMNIDNRKNNMLTKKFLINDYKKRSQQDYPDNQNIYQLFLNFVEKKPFSENNVDKIYDIITCYFEDLLNRCFI